METYDLSQPIGLDPPRRTSVAALALAFLVLVGIALVPAYLGALVIDQEFYDSLAAGPWLPPIGTFPIAWVVTQALIGVAAWRVWRTGPGVQRRLALYWFAVEVAVASEWMPAFFGRRSLTAGLAMSVALLVATGGTLATFAERSRRAAKLVIPAFVIAAALVLLMTALWTLNL